MKHAPLSEKTRKALEFWKSNPVEAVKDWFDVTPEDYQAVVLNAMFRDGHDRVVDKSCHGAGKTALHAFVGWVFLNCFEQSRLVATAPVAAQLHDALWPEYAKWHQKMPEELRQMWDVTATHIRNKSAPMVWFGTARTSNKAANLQGFHGTNILIEADEMSAIAQDIFETIEGTLSEAGEQGKVALFFGAGNPNFLGGEFYDAFGKNKDLYFRVTQTGDPAFLETLEFEGKPVEQGGYHPAHGYTFYSKRVTKKYRETMARKYGSESAVFDVRVRGVFPRHQDDAVIPFQSAEAAALREPPAPLDPVADPVRIVMDPSRGGAAETVVGAFRRRACVRMQAYKTTNTEACVDLLADAVAYWKTKGVTISHVIVDEPGVGGGVVDSAKRREIPVIGYHGGRGLVKGVDPAEDCRMFANVRARDWWNVRRMFEAELVSMPNDNTLVDQLASVKYAYNKQDKIQVEAKYDLIKRLGEDASPDRADVIVMGLAPWYSLTESDNAAVGETDFYGTDDRVTTEFAREMDIL